MNQRISPCSVVSWILHLSIWDTLITGSLCYLFDWVETASLSTSEFLEIALHMHFIYKPTNLESICLRDLFYQAIIQQATNFSALNPGPGKQHYSNWPIQSCFTFPAVPFPWKLQ